MPFRPGVNGPAVLVGLDGLQRRLDAVKRAPERIGIEWAKATVEEAKIHVPRKTGNLGRSIVPGSITKTSAEVIARAGYAAYVEKGTPAHLIVPRTKKALAFIPGDSRSYGPGGNTRLSGRPTASGGGERIVRKSVRHPGTEPKPFLIPAAREARAILGLGTIVELWNKAD